MRPQLVTTGAVFVLCLGLGPLLHYHAPWTDDARFYVPAAKSYANWVEAVVTGELSPFDAAARDRAFAINREHPPVGKYVMGATWWLFSKKLGWHDIAGARVGVTVLWALTCAMVWWALVGVRGFGAAAFGTLALIVSPRFFFHGHVETLDLPVTAWITATWIVFAVYLRQRRWAFGVASVVLFALALGTKLNAPFAWLSLVLAVVLACGVRREKLSWRMPPIPWPLVGMVTLSPLLVLALWPWLWRDTAARLGQYIEFHLHHYPIFFFFQGTLYEQDIAPWYAPWVMLGICVPVVMLGFALAQAVVVATKLWRRMSDRRAALQRSLAPLGAHPAFMLGLVALCVFVVQMAAVSWPTAPKYGGIKLFLPAIPPLAVLGGLAWGVVHERVSRLELRVPGRFVSWAALTIMWLPASIDLWASKEAPLSYYNGLVGGAQGAFESGYERQYYDLAYPRIPVLLAQALPEGGTFTVVPNPKEYASHTAHWHQTNALPSNIRFVGKLEQADVVILTHERRFKQYPKLYQKMQYWEHLGGQSHRGVPLWDGFRSPRVVGYGDHNANTRTFWWLVPVSHSCLCAVHITRSILAGLVEYPRHEAGSCSVPLPTFPHTGGVQSGSVRVPICARSSSFIT